MARLTILGELVVLALASLTLVACGAAPLPTPVASPTRASTAIPTSLPPASSAPTLTPTSTSTATPTIRTTPTRTPTLAVGTMRIKLFFVALEDNGKSGKKIGCNDSIVAVDRTIPATNAPLTAALKELFSIHDRTYGQSGLYNALANANLKIDRVSIVNAKATINISGPLGLGGVCDDPRVIAQIKELALQFATVKAVSVFINGVPIEKALSGKGN